MVLLGNKITVEGAPITTIAKGVIQGLGGLADFVHTVRSTYGGAGDFAEKNGFDYGQVYNGLLQYQVVNAYLNRNNAENLEEIKEEQAKLKELILVGGIIIVLEIAIFIVLKIRKTRNN